MYLFETVSVSMLLRQKVCVIGGVWQHGSITSLHFGHNIRNQSKEKNNSCLLSAFYCFVFFDIKIIMASLVVYCLIKSSQIFNNLHVGHIKYKNGISSQLTKKDLTQLTEPVLRATFISLSKPGLTNHYIQVASGRDGNCNWTGL